MTDTTKEILLGAAGVGLVGLIVYGKYKLAFAKPVWWIIILGALVFVASSPAKAE